MTNSENQHDKFHRLPAVMRMTGLGRTSIYDAIKAGTFPAPVRIGVRSVAWPESRVVRWQNERLAAAEA